MSSLLQLLAHRLKIPAVVLMALMLSVGPMVAQEPASDPVATPGTEIATESTEEATPTETEVALPDVTETPATSAPLAPMSIQPLADSGGFVFPTTNAANAIIGWPHVAQVLPATCGQITLDLYPSQSWTAGVAHYEILVNGESWNGFTAPNHPILGNGVMMYGGVSVSNAGNDPLRHSFPGTTVEVRHALGAENDAYFDWVTFETVPCVGTANVTITRNYPEVTSVDLPAGTTWTVTNRDTSEVVATGAVSGPFPANLSVPNLPYGNYTFKLSNMGPQFKTQTSGGAPLDAKNFTVSGPTVAVSLPLQLTAMGAFFPLRSTNAANAANGQAHVVQQEATCGEVSVLFNNPTATLAYFEILVDGAPWNGYTGGAHEVVPGSPQYGGLNIWGSASGQNPPGTGNTFLAPHTRTFTGDVVQIRFALGTPGTAYFDWVTFEAEPCDADVTVNVSSADPAIANALPAGATWAVSQGGTALWTDTFAPEHLTLPVSIPVTNPIPYGTYEVTVSGGPTFAAYTASFVVDGETETFDIVLVPVPPTPTAPVETPSPTATSEATPSPTATSAVTPTATSTPVKVTELPETGQGSANGSGFLLAALAGAGLLAAGVGIMIRRERA